MSGEKQERLLEIFLEVYMEKIFLSGVWLMNMGSQQKASQEI